MTQQWEWAYRSACPEAACTVHGADARDGSAAEASRIRLDQPIEAKKTSSSAHLVATRRKADEG